MNLREFAQHKFDVLALLLINTLILWLLVHLSHHEPGSVLLTWATRSADTWQGALIAILVSGRGGFRKVDSNGKNGNGGNGHGPAVDTLLPGLREAAPEIEPR